MKNKKVVALLCALMLALVTAGCTAAPSAGPNAGDAATPTLDKIREKGTLIVATESTYPPFEFIVVENGQPQYVGMDVELGKAVAAKLGVEFVQSEMAFDSIIAAIQAGTVDISASFTPDDERRQVVDFSEIYYESSNVFLVRVEDKDNYPTRESFDGKIIGAQQGTLQNKILTDDMVNAKNLILPKVSTLIQELKVGNIDAICLEKPVADCYVAAAKGAYAIATFDFPDTDSGVAMPVAKGQQDLVDFVNGVIAEMKANGEMQRIYDEAVALAIDQIIGE